MLWVTVLWRQKSRGWLGVPPYPLESSRDGRSEKPLSWGAADILGVIGLVVSDPVAAPKRLAEIDADPSSAPLSIKFLGCFLGGSYATLLAAFRRNDSMPGWIANPRQPFKEAS